MKMLNTRFMTFFKLKSRMIVDWNSLIWQWHGNLLAHYQCFGDSLRPLYTYSCHRSNISFTLWWFTAHLKMLLKSQQKRSPRPLASHPFDGSREVAPLGCWKNKTTVPILLLEQVAHLPHLAAETMCFSNQSSAQHGFMVPMEHMGPMVNKQITESKDDQFQNTMFQNYMILIIFNIF